ncbi:hypothetical protein [Vibrio chaetopteri]|jgi:hypothetical protein|uniref:Uncharacterized protein n=1 Tax=Vibrio chaetopteri TaxID=3016528 RepID=A0AAU8BT84_9VIBR
MIETLIVLLCIIAALKLVYFIINLYKELRFVLDEMSQIKDQRIASSLAKERINKILKAWPLKWLDKPMNRKENASNF